MWASVLVIIVLSNGQREYEILKSVNDSNIVLVKLWEKEEMKKKTR